MSDKVMVTMLHIRKARMCSGGTRAFFLRHRLNWSLFLKQGIEAEKLAATGDAMALQVVKVAEADGRR